MRLIDADAIVVPRDFRIEHFHDQIEDKVAYDLGSAVKKLLDAQPTVESIVRCKDCKFCTYEPCKDYENVYICNRTYWSREDGGLLPNHYCAWGERK